MKWLLELSDLPESTTHPIVGFPVYENGVKGTQRYFSIQDIVNALTESETGLEDVEGEIKEEEHTPILPRNTIRYSKSPCDTRQRITMEIPKHRAFIKHVGLEEELIEIGFPRMVVQFLVEKTKDRKKMYMQKQTRIFALRDDNQPIQEDTPLFTFPFPNVMKGSGVVCWGSNSPMEYDCLSELQRAFVWFTSSPFNEDYGVSTLSTQSNKTSFLKYIETFHSSDFNDDELVPYKNNFSSLFINN